MDEMDRIKFCSDFNKPWYPQDQDKLESALKVHKRWLPDPGKTFILDFPWPAPGEIPKVPYGLLKPSEEEKNKIRALVEEYEGPKMDPLTEMIVQLAKDLLQDIH